MIHTADWKEVAKMILKERGAEGDEISCIFIKDGKINVETTTYDSIQHKSAG